VVKEILQSLATLRRAPDKPLQSMATGEDYCYNGSMPLSARNQLPGTIEDLQIGDIMAHVVVKVGDNFVESIITRNSVEELGLKKGDAVKVVVKSTEVMIQKG